MCNLTGIYDAKMEYIMSDAHATIAFMMATGVDSAIIDEYKQFRGERFDAFIQPLIVERDRRDRIRARVKSSLVITLVLITAGMAWSAW